MQSGGRIAVMLGDEAAGVWLVAADGVAERPQRLFHRLCHDADATRAVTVAQHKFRPRTFVPMPGGRGHGMAIDQHGGAEIPVQAGKQTAQGAVIRLVQALDSRSASSTGMRWS